MSYAGPHHDGSQTASTTRGGGFGIFAPWPAPTVLYAGGACGSYVGERAHQDWNARWEDDHYAIDFGVCGDADEGLPVLAAHDGVVREARLDKSYGWTVVVERRPNGQASRYAHLERLEPGLEVGDRVVAGQPLGSIGHSGAGGGSAKNAHLHFVLYSSRGRHAGMKIESLAAVDPCDGCRIESLTQINRKRTPSVRAAVDAIQPDRPLSAPAGGFTSATVVLRFDRAFDASRFVLRPSTDRTRRFSSTHDVLGTAAGARTAEYTLRLGTGDDTPTGDYALRWDLVDAQTRRQGNARVPLDLRVTSPPFRTRPCPPAASEPLGPQPTSPDFKATLDDEFPMNRLDGTIPLHRNDAGIAFGYNVRFTKPFQQTFVLRPQTKAAINTFVPSFGTPGEEFPGAVAPNDDHVGYYRSQISVPACVPNGNYFVQWYVVDNNNGRYAELAPSFVANVVSRPPGNGD